MRGWTGFVKLTSAFYSDHTNNVACERPKLQGRRVPAETSLAFALVPSPAPAAQVLWFGIFLLCHLACVLVRSQSLSPPLRSPQSPRNPDSGAADLRAGEAPLTSGLQAASVGLVPTPHQTIWRGQQGHLPSGCFRQEQETCRGTQTSACEEGACRGRHAKCPVGAGRSHPVERRGRPDRTLILFLDPSEGPEFPTGHLLRTEPRACRGAGQGPGDLRSSKERWEGFAKGDKPPEGVKPSAAGIGFPISPGVNTTMGQSLQGGIPLWGFILKVLRCFKMTPQLVFLRTEPWASFLISKKGTSDSRVFGSEVTALSREAGVSRMPLTAPGAWRVPRTPGPGPPALTAAVLGAGTARSPGDTGGVWPPELVFAQCRSSALSGCVPGTAVCSSQPAGDTNAGTGTRSALGVLAPQLSCRHRMGSRQNRVTPRSQADLFQVFHSRLSRPP